MTLQDRSERTKKFALYLQLKFSEFQDKKLRGGMRRRPSQNEFIAWLGVEQSSYSNWVNGIRPPGPESLDVLAGKLGLEVYEILGVSPRLPNDKHMRSIAKNWHKLSDQQKRELVERILNQTDQEDTDGSTETSQ
jgi:transcriptional regulator with XRE-family HTH domain